MSGELREKMGRLREAALAIGKRSWKFVGNGGEPYIRMARKEGATDGWVGLSFDGLPGQMEYVALACPETVLELLDYVSELEGRLAEIPEDSEERVKWAMRLHSGGLGASLGEEEKKLITEGRPDAPENAKPFDGKKFLEGAREALKDFPFGSEDV